MINKTIRKLLLAVTTAAVIFSSVTALASDSVFKDMETNHWAYADILHLVNEGTISGYPSGEFKPMATVTRAEFTKMIGGGTQSGRTFADVAENHWVYSYAAKSDLKADGNNNFNPDMAITRGDTVYPMYAKAGKPEPDMSKVPDHIKQLGGKEIWWIYSTGVMIGNDGINLRLEDTLTRAEAAALIMKADRAAKAGGKTEVKVTDDVLEYVYGAINIFDTPYSANANMTYGELAKATLRMSQNSFDINYDYYYFKDEFDHKYARPMFVVCKRGLGEDKLSAETADKNITLGDTIKCFNIAMKMRLGKEINFAPKISGNKSDMVTHKQLAQLIVQYDEEFGLIYGYYPELDEFGYRITESNKMVKELDKLPENYPIYRYIMEGVPAEVYAIDGDIKKEPKDVTNFATTFATMFTPRCRTLAELIKEKYNQTAEVIFYPSLTYDNGDGFVTTIKVVIKNDNGNTHKASEMFGTALVNCSTGDTVKTGSVIYVKMANDGYIPQ